LTDTALQETTSRALLTAELKARARASGFDKVGVVRAEPLLEERARLEEWLRRGFHAGMAWMARDPGRRTDPAQLLPGARSVVVVALNYYTPHRHTGEPGTGKISRYAWGDDYHDVLGEKLGALLDSAREEDHCGTCTLCLEACPTGAITEPYVVSSERCISHATIELRADELPAHVAEHLEGWLYGCDICQDVCPWNRFEQPTAEARFEPRPESVSAELSAVLRLTPEAYAERFRRSPLKRAKLPGLRRNARALLKNEGDDRGDAE
jgi:epoxyqueuosine reductase